MVKVNESGHFAMDYSIRKINKGTSHRRRCRRLNPKWETAKTKPEKKMGRRERKREGKEMREGFRKAGYQTPLIFK